MILTMSLSELSVSLINLNIPFVSNGTHLILDRKDCGNLINNKIPFSFRDGKIFLEKPKPKNEKVLLMETIKNLLTLTNRFDVSKFEEPNEDTTHVNLYIKYKGMPCTMQLYCNKLVLGYYRWTSTINFKSSCTVIKELLPLFEDGFVLLLIAGFKHQICPVNWTNWAYGNLPNGFNFECQYVDKKFKFVENDETYYVRKLDIAIINSETFIL